MSFFNSYFDTEAVDGEVAVRCPFPHQHVDGSTYYEEVPSAHVNMDKRLFHCKVCGVGLNEVGFAAQHFGMQYKHARLLVGLMDANAGTTQDWREAQQSALGIHELPYVNDFGLTAEVIDELMISTDGIGDLQFPVIINDHIIDARTYNPDQNPKVKSAYGSMSGLIIPYDLWKLTPKQRLTLICAGEKDMAIARSHGFNAITITGGEGTKPRLKEEFKDRHIAIVYDNDGAGIAGAKKIAFELFKDVASIRVVTNFHERLEHKGDIADFFMQGGTREELIQYIESTEFYIPSESESNLPMVDLHSAGLPKYKDALLSANIQVIATSDETFQCPRSFEVEKIRLSEKDGANTMAVGESIDWDLESSNLGDILYLIDNNFKTTDIRKNQIMLAKIPATERSLRVTEMDHVVVHKLTVTDMFETSNQETMPTEYTAYSVGHRLESGKKYKVDFKIVPHPYKGQKQIMVIHHATMASDSVTNFALTSDQKRNLQVVKSAYQGMTVAEIVHDLSERAKHFIGYDGINLLIETIDLAYHTPLYFNLGRQKDIRAHLDAIIVGESRVGKSSAAIALQELYGLGTFTSLAGNSATVAGLIGGSSKTSTGGLQTKAGLIPQNHQGMIIFEEFGKSNNDIIRELTDIRSSNKVRITRISGTLELPANVRMLALTNVKNHGGAIKPIATYPNGVDVLTELIGSAEDIARYDIMLVLEHLGSNSIDPFWTPREPFSEDVYRTKVRWVWSRKADDILITEDVGRYIIEQANQLNAMYSSHLKIFGTEAWKKLSRLAIAVAGYVVSTDQTFEKIVVGREHVDFAVDYFKRIYDNSTFRLAEYVAHERSLTTIDTRGVEELSELYAHAPSVLQHLEINSKTTRNNIAAASGLNNEALGTVLNRLVKGMFLELRSNEIRPTQRFRLGMREINRDILPARRNMDVTLQMDPRRNQNSN